MNLISKTSLFYNTEVVVWRGRGALFWSTSLPFFCCLILVTITNFSIAHPYTWIISLVSSLVSLSFWMFVVLVCVVYWLLMSHRIKFFSVIPEVRVSKWSAVHSVVQPRRLFHIFLLASGCSFICWCILHVIEGSYQSLVKPCIKHNVETCLNEQHVFIMLHSTFIGLLGGIVFFSCNHNLIQYPVIQQSKWGQSRSDIATLMLNSAKFVLSKLKYFYLAYYLFIGAACKSWIISYLPIHIDASQRVDSIFGLLDFWLFLTTWVTGTLLYFFTSMFTVMYTAYQTKPYEFVIQCDLEEEEKKKLVDALACDTFPLLQFQGYQDLCLLAKHSARRRCHLFSLSALGGHPHNWISIYGECLSSLRKFGEDVKCNNNKTLANGSVRQLSGDSNRRNADVTFRGADETRLSNKPVDSNDNDVVLKESFAGKMYRELIKQKTIAHLVAPNPESSNRVLLSQSQKYIWNIEALSHIVTASYKEDTYGVVQKSLPEIISTFVTLQEEIEKMIKLGSTLSRTGAESDLENALHTRLRVTLKSAIYNVGSVFGQHVESLTLPQEVKKRLHHYSEYKV